jgi:tol-pal system protein YbgF
VTRAPARAGVLLLLATAGCATRAELLQQDRQIRGVVREQNRQLQQVQKELERLRAEMEEGGGRRASGGGGGEDRVAQLERRVAQLEAGTGTAPPPAEPTPPGEPESEAPPVANSPPTTQPPPAPAPEEDAWRRDVAREQSAAGAVDVPERAEYLAALDVVARKECGRGVPQLNSFAAKYRESPLADNALYWAARCHAQGRDQNQAISKFYEVVTRYPKGDKVPAALWEQGNLFIAMGNTPDARIVLGKLIREYPGSDEAARARQRLSELQN